MRVIVVGIHNKKGLEPLDSSTKSGKLIDRIAKELKVKVCKTNLFNVDYLPKSSDVNRLKAEWLVTHKPTNDDVVVLLGSKVQKEFDFKANRLVKIKHPASQWSHKSMNEYVTSAVKKISSYSTPGVEY